MSTCTWADVTARLDEARAVLAAPADAAVSPADDTAPIAVAVGHLVDTVRRWHAEQVASIAARLDAGPDARRDALCAEERLQRVDDLVSTLWTMTQSAAPAAAIRAVLVDLAAV